MIKSEELKEQRRNAGLTQVEAARMVYTSERTWRKWERAIPIGKADKDNFKARTELFEFKLAQIENKG